MTGGPMRLFEAGSEAPDGLRGLLQEARNVGPTAAQTARLAAKLGPAFGGVASASVVAGLSSGAKLGAALAVAGAVAGGALWFGFASPTPQKPAAPATQQVPAAIPPQRPSAEAVPAEAQPSPSATDEAERATPAKEPATPRVSEAALLERARAALKANPAAALSLTREHAERFPKGVLAQEREIIAIDALSRLKREGEAAGRAADFKKRYPDSPHQRKLESLRK